MRTAAARSAEPAGSRTPAPASARSAPTSGPTGAFQHAPIPALRLGSAPGPGAPLSGHVRTPIEASLGASLAHARVHQDARSNAAVDAMGARAVTVGRDVYLGPRESASDVALLAHEAAHVLQQQHGGTGLPMTKGPNSSGALEREADAAASAVMRGEPMAVTGRTAPTAQRQDQSAPWWRRAGQWVGDVASGVVEFGESIGWKLLDQFAPELVPIIRQGPLDWLKERLSAAVESVFNGLLGPVRAISGVGSALIGHFNNLLSWIRDAAARIARGDCGPISEAAERIQQVFEALVAPAVDRLKQLATTVKEFFNGLWERFGAPVWEFLKTVGGAVWGQLQRLGQWIWEKTEPIRRVLARAWTWVKNKLGVGEGPEGQDGLLQWVQRKAGEAWDTHIKPFLERYKRPLMVVGGVLVMLSPAGPVIAIGAAIGGLIVGVRWIRQNLRSRDGVVSQREYLKQVIIPGILNAVDRVSAFLMQKARFIADKLTEVVSGLNQAVGAVAGSILNFAVSILQWLLDRFRELVEWALNGLVGLADLITAALQRLQAFLRPILRVLEQIARTIAHIMELPLLLAGEFWNRIPACIRNPFIDFFIPLILRQIDFFRELVATPEAWSQTKADVMELIREVFRTFDLVGAIKTAFRLLLRALRVPVALAIEVWQRAMQAWDVVLAHPIQFLKNIVRALGRGFGKFFGGILGHLWFGVQAWLFESSRETGVSPPASWTDPRAVFGFVLDVLGISLDHVLDLLAQRIGRPAVNRIRSAIRFLTGAWEWLKIAIEQGPRGLWQKLVAKLRDLGRKILESAVGWVMQRVIAIASARITAILASAGLSGVVEAMVAIYSAIQTAIEYARRILEILNTVFTTIVQIAQGVIDPAADMLVAGLRMAMPMVIGFLAKYIRLGGLPERVREIIGMVREKVDEGILWLIDQALALGRGLLNLLSRAGSAIRDWWHARFGFRARDGEPHTISIEGSVESADIVVESQRTYLRDLINQITDPDLRQRANAKAAQILAIVREGRAVRDDAQLDEKATALTKELKAMSEILVEAGVLERGSQMLPSPTFDFSTAGGRAKRAVVTNLSANRTMGSEPFEDPDGWDYLQTNDQTTGAPYFRRMHLVNRLFGGPGMRSNLAPGPQEANSDHLYNVENKIKELVGERPLAPDKRAVVLNYTVEVNYRSSLQGFPNWPSPPVRIAYFPSSFDCSWTYVERWPKGNQTPKGKSYVVRIGPPR